MAGWSWCTHNVFLVRVFMTTLPKPPFDTLAHTQLVHFGQSPRRPYAHRLKGQMDATAHLGVRRRGGPVTRCVAGSTRGRVDAAHANAQAKRMYAHHACVCTCHQRSMSLPGSSPHTSALAWAL